MILFDLVTSNRTLQHPFKFEDTMKRGGKEKVEEVHVSGLTTGEMLFIPQGTGSQNLEDGNLARESYN